MITSRTRWMRDWLAERLKLVHGCVDLQPHEVSSWEMFASETIKEMDRVDAAVTAKPEVPDWLDHLMVELMAKTKDPALSEVDRIMANGTLLSLQIAQSKALVRHNNQLIGDSAELIGRLINAHGQPHRGVRMQALRGQLPAEFIQTELQRMLTGELDSFNYNGLTAFLMPSMAEQLSVLMGTTPPTFAVDEARARYQYYPLTEEGIKTLIGDLAREFALQNPDNHSLLDHLVVTRAVAADGQSVREQFQVAYVYAWRTITQSPA